ncbi:MAG: hypothetical protein Fur0041_16160 [Bacteroidia bacterium]
MGAERYQDSTLGQLLPARVRRSCRLIFQDTLRAMVAVWLRDSVISKDYYVFLVKKDTWKLKTIKSLQGTHIAEREIKRLDSIPVADRGKKYSSTHQHSWAFERNALQLWLSSDKMLENHWNRNSKKFMKLAGYMKRKGYFSGDDARLASVMKDKKAKRLCEQLLIRDIKADSSFPGNYFFIIGGIGDNIVGYLYNPYPERHPLPVIFELRYIFIDPLNKGWCIFKST